MLSWKPVYPMMAHQRKEFEKTKDKEYWAHFHEMGCGKSKVVIDTLAHNFSVGKIDRAVIMAKSGEFSNWCFDQLPEHWPTEIPMQSFLYSSQRAGVKSFTREFKKFLDLPSTVFKILVCNVEALSGSKLEDYLDDFFYRKSVALIVDESTCVKNHAAARTKKLLKYAPRAKLRRIMTGTAVTESPLDLWGQCLVLKRGILGHASFASFRDDYCEREEQTTYGGNTFKTTTGFKNLDRLSKVIGTFSTQILKKDCLDLPDKIYVKKVLEMAPKSRERYDKLRDQALTDLGTRQVEVLNALATVIKLHQMTSGQARDEDGVYHWLGSEKMDATLELLSNHRGKAIIWCPFKMGLLKLVECVGRELGPRWVRGYFGGVSTSDRAEAVRSFQQDPDGVRFLVGNQQSMGFGTTLNKASLEIFYANSYRLELRLQSEDRAHRIGQTENVAIVDLVCRDTVDERLYQSLRSKKKMSDFIMSRPPSQWL